MASTLNDKFAEGQAASMEQQLSNLEREAGIGPSVPPTSMKTSRPPPATSHRLADWRHAAFVGSLSAASIGVAAWWWSSSADTAMMAPSDPTPLTQAAPETDAPKDVASAAVALSSELAQQLQPMARESQTLTERVNASQEQPARGTASASEPEAMPEAPKMMPEEPTVMPEIPLPRPRQAATVGQAQKPTPTPARPQSKKPHPLLAWPWSVR